MEKLYEEIVFENENSPALNASNLNAISHALAQIDERVVDGYTKAIEAGLVAENLESLIDDVEQAKNDAEGSATNAETSATNAETSATNASASAVLSESYAKGGTETREGENSDNSKYYYEKAKEIYTSLGSALTPKGSVYFADLPAFADIEVGFLYNILDDFTTDSRFREGSGKNYNAGSNVYYVIEENNHYWDVMGGGSSVLVDTELNKTSNNPISNGAVATKVEQIETSMVTSQADAEQADVAILSVNNSPINPKTTASAVAIDETTLALKIAELEETIEELKERETMQPIQNLTPRTWVPQASVANYDRPHYAFMDWGRVESKTDGYYVSSGATYAFTLGRLYQINTGYAGDAGTSSGYWMSALASDTKVNDEEYIHVDFLTPVVVKFAKISSPLLQTDADFYKILQYSDDGETWHDASEQMRYYDTTYMVKYANSADSSAKIAGNAVLNNINTEEAHQHWRVYMNNIQNTAKRFNLSNCAFYGYYPN